MYFEGKDKGLANLTLGFNHDNQLATMRILAIKARAPSVKSVIITSVNTIN